MRINTNIASMTAQENASNVNKNLSSSLEKLSSGLRINKAADDSSGMAIADKLRTQASALGQSISNANSANALVQIADKAMAEQSNILDIVKTKLIQASTQTTSDEGREAIRKDVSKLLEQLDNIAGQTNYNGINLLDTKGAEFSFQVGEKASYDISTTTAFAANTAGLGGGSNAITSGTNIVAGDALSVAAAGAITIKGVDDAADTTATTFEVTVSGKLGSLVTAGANTISLDSTNESESVKAALDAIAANNGDFTKSGDVYTITTAATIELGDINFNALKVTNGAATATASFNNSDGSAINITNIGTTNQVDVAGTDMTGGSLLSSLKNLSENGLTSDVANSFMESVDVALNQINTVRSDFGSTQNQLDSFVRNAMTTQTNIKAAESVIRDVDYAAESANFNKQNIIAQAGTYAMSQANAVQQNVMRLLQ